jgi:hypothetical protein
MIKRNGIDGVKSAQIILIRSIITVPSHNIKWRMRLMLEKGVSPELPKISCLDIYQRFHMKPLYLHKLLPDEESHGD